MRQAHAELERLRAEQALHDSEAKRIEALVRSDALKSALLSSVSHEFRTPLTVLKASLANLPHSYGQGLPGALEEFLLAANQDIDYLSHLVENLLNMSQIEAGALALKREWQPIEDLLEGPLRRLQGKLGTRTVTLDIPDGLPAVLVDGVQVQQVLLNLLDNAVKYSPTGSLYYLGVEAYGLVGFFVFSQSVLQLLDLGLAPTINREVARCRTQGNMRDAAELLRTFAIIYWAVGALILVCFFLAAPYIASYWLNAESDDGLDTRSGGRTCELERAE